MKKKSSITVIFIILLLLAFSTSYALWNMTLKQEGVNELTTDCFQLSFEESDDISLENAYPIENSKLNEFFKTAKPFHFTVKNNCASVSSLSINLESLQLEGKTIPEEYLGVAFWEGEKGTKMDDELNEKDNYFYGYLLENLAYTIPISDNSYAAHELYYTYIGENESREFNLLLYLNESTPPTPDVMNASYQSKVTIQANYVNEEDVIEQQKPYITKIVFENSLQEKAGENIIFRSKYGLYGMDNIMNYLEKENDGYTLYIQGNQKIALPENSSGLFAEFYSLESIEGLEYVDTSKVKDMSSLFSSCPKLTTLDLSSFNTDNVENMRGMFYGCRNLKNLNISSFNTNNVTDIRYLFYYCENLITTINITGSKITSYQGLFNLSALRPPAQITVNYIAETSDLVDQMLQNKSDSSNVVKGTLIS